MDTAAGFSMKRRCLEAWRLGSAIAGVGRWCAWGGAGKVGTRAWPGEGGGAALPSIFEYDTSFVTAVWRAAEGAREGTGFTGVFLEGEERAPDECLPPGPGEDEWPEMSRDWSGSIDEGNAAEEVRRAASEAGLTRSPAAATFLRGS